MRHCRSCVQLVEFNIAKSVPPTPDSRALGRAAQRQQQERAARKREHARRRQAHRDRRAAEYR
jgi:hypothetical protein